MDPISDMFIRIKNASRAGKESVHIPYSKFKHELLKAIERRGFIAKIERKGKRVRKVLEVALRYENAVPVMKDLRLISKPSRRIYASSKNIGRARSGGMLLLSTPLGVLSGGEARKKKVGGEVVAEIW